MTPEERHKLKRDTREALYWLCLLGLPVVVIVWLVGHCTREAHAGESVEHRAPLYAPGFEAFEPTPATGLFRTPLARAALDANGDGIAGFSAPLGPLRFAVSETFRAGDHHAAYLQADGYLDLARLSVTGWRVVAHGWLSLGSAFDAPASALLGETGARVALCAGDYAGGFYVEAGKGHNADWFVGFGAIVAGDLDAEWSGRAAFTPRFALGRSFERWAEKTVALAQPLLDARIGYRLAPDLRLGLGWSYWPDVQDERALRADGRDDPIRSFAGAFARIGEWSTFYIALEFTAAA